MNHLSIHRIPALLALLFAALLAGSVPAAATDLGSAAVLAIGEQAADDDKRADGTDSPDPDAVCAGEVSGVEAPPGPAVPVQINASVASKTALSYRARAPPAN